MRILFATCSAQEADALVETLLEERLIGCANVVPGVRSHYWWEGEICHDEEVLLFMETADEKAALKEFLNAERRLYSQSQDNGGEELVWRELCQMVLASSQFLYLE